MLVEFKISITKKPNALLSNCCHILLGGKYEETIPENLAENMIKAFDLKIEKTVPTERLKQNRGHFDVIYS